MAGFLPETKRRVQRHGLVSYEDRPSGIAPWTPHPWSVGGLTEEIVSQCHTGLWPPPLDSDKDVGGPMQLHRTRDEHTVTGDVDWFHTRGTIGIAQITGYSLGISPAIAGSVSNLNQFGASAVAAVLPTNPISSMSTALAELKKDGIPRLPGSSMRSQVSAARRSGDEYLNIEFGWLPLVNDLRDFAKAVRNARVLVNQYIRDSDRKIRRRLVLPTSRSTSVFNGNALCFGQNNFGPDGSVSRSDSTRYWFSGAFKYHVPVGSDLLSRLDRYESLVNHLFGLRITPELVWNIAPWSWAVDWFTNVGDVIHNVTALGSDGLVMQYGYAMRHMRVEEIVRCTCFKHGTGGSPDSVRLERVISSEWKQRVRANPYGFGIDDVDLSARQLAILAALGLTRGQRTQ